MIVKFKKLDSKAVIPTKIYENDFCYDITAISCEEIAPGVYKYGTGLAMEIVKGEIGQEQLILSLDMRPRSSIWKHGMVLANSVGTIDQDYRGEICAIFYHINKELPIYKIGDKVAQIKLGMTFPIEFTEVFELSKTERNSGGFGSTDNNKKAK